VKILIMGLPGSSKTTLGKKLSKEYDIPLWDAAAFGLIRGCFDRI
jgi:adenylate kinase family enzyme